MFFNADEEDQDFIAPSGGNKLASLFGVETQQAEHSSFHYSAPKQPKKSTKKDEQNAAAPSSPTVLHAVATHAFKYIDGKYAPQGKLGTAILGSHSQNDYKLLLYLSKTQQVTNAKISPSFTYTVQPQNYANFYDDARQSWSIMFDSEQSAVQFAKQIALAKANSAGSGLDSVVIQDLLNGEGGVLESGDSAEVKYTGWLHTDNKFGEVFDSNASADKLFRFKLGKGKVIKGWEDGVLGMQKGGRRLLVVPPQLAYGTQGMGNKVPANSTLIFDIEVVRVKLNKEKESPQTSLAPSPAPSTETDFAEEPDVKTRSRSISDQMSQSPKTDKAKLISRMAKMGKPMLPLSGAVPAQPDSDEDEEIQNVTKNTPPSVKPELPNKPVVHPVPQPAVQPPPVQPIPQSFTSPAQPMAEPVMMQAPPPAAQSVPGMPVASQVALYQNPMQYQHAGMQYGYQQPVPQPQFGPVYSQQPYPSQPAPSQPMSDPHMPVLMSETRQQNTEVRIAISKVQDKVDKVLEKLEHLHTQNNMAVQPATMPGMESGLLVHNIERIVQENDKLKKEIFDKSSQIEAQNEKIAELIKRNQRYMEESNALLEHQSDSFTTTANQSQAKVLQLEQEKVQLATELSLANSRLATVQLEVGALKKQEGELKQKLEGFINTGSQQKDDILKFKSQAAEYSNKVTELTQSLKDERQARKSLEEKLSGLEEEFKDVQTANLNYEKTLSDRKKKAVIEKKEMEKDLEDLKTQYEEELQVLRNRLRKQKSSTGIATAEQVAQVEKELREEWEEKCERLVSANQEKNSRVLRDLQEEKQSLQDKVTGLEERLSSVKTARGEHEKQVESLHEQVEELRLWKDRYESLRSQAAFMKERYEERLTELVTERDEALEAAHRTKPAGEASLSKEELATEVKKIMNSVFHQLRGEFEADKAYQGTQIHSSILNTIKDVTLKMVRAEKQEEEEEEEEETESEEEDNVPESQQVAAVQRTSAQLTAGEEIVKQTIVASSAVLSGGKGGDDRVEVVAASSVSHSGARGNPGYLQELIQDEKEEIVAAATVSQSGGRGNPSYLQELTQKDDTQNAVPAATVNVSGASYLQGLMHTAEENIVVAKVANITGDRGNTRYLDQLKRDQEAEIEDMVVANVAHVTGDRGNTRYAQQLNQSPKDQIEEVVVAKVTNVTGDRGNVRYAEELNKSPPVEVEDIVVASVSNVTGDRGNMRYSQQLQKNAEVGVEDLVVASISNVTGDRGNVLYCQELEKNPEVIVEEKMVASSAHITGGHGNVRYAEELLKAGKEAEKSGKAVSVDDTTVIPAGEPRDTSETEKTSVEKHIIEKARENGEQKSIGEKGDADLKPSSPDKIVKTKKETKSSDAEDQKDKVAKDKSNQSAEASHKPSQSVEVSHKPSQSAEVSQKSNQSAKESANSTQSATATSDKAKMPDIIDGTDKVKAGQNIKSSSDKPSVISSHEGKPPTKSDEKGATKKEKPAVPATEKQATQKKSTPAEKGKQTTEEKPAVTPKEKESTPSEKQSTKVPSSGENGKPAATATPTDDTGKSKLDTKTSQPKQQTEAGADNTAKVDEQVKKSQEASSKDDKAAEANQKKQSTGKTVSEIFGDDDDDLLFSGVKTLSAKTTNNEKGKTESKTQSEKSQKTSSLFGDDDDDFDFTVKTKDTKAAKTTKKSPEKKEDKKKNDSDDDLKQRPPPLFGDEDDDDDIDWFK